MTKLKILGKSLVSAVKTKDLVAVAKDYGELAVDHGLTEGVLKEVPIVKTILALASAGKAIKDQILAQKIIKFLDELSSVSPSDREEMLHRLDEEIGFKGQVGERIVELLERSEKSVKPRMIASAFKAFAQGKVSQLELHRLLLAIERIPLHELYTVRCFFDADREQRLSMEIPALYALSMAGLAVRSETWDAAYEPTWTCKLFLDIGLDRVDPK